jgi:hypothetical protein
MKFGLILSAGALAVAAVAVAATPLQDAKAKTRGDDKAAAAGAMDPALMAKMMELGTPGPEHAELKKMVGAWQIKMKCWMVPGAPAMDSTGTSTIEMANDRHLLEHFKGEMPGMGPYEGWGVMGFNNATKEYEHVWRDAFNTGMMWSNGTKAADGTITMSGSSTCAEGPMTCRTVSKMNGNDAFHFEMYCTVQGQPEAKSMEMDYTRGGATSR